MKPDFEDYNDVEDEKPATSRAMSWVVLAVAVGGFATLAYYAYNSGDKAANGGDAVVIEADGSPIKEAPAEAGGEQFPNQDKTIYNAITPGEVGTASEKLLPDAEQPAVAATNVEDSEDDAAPSVAATATAAAPAAAAPAATPALAATPSSKPAAGAPAVAPATTTYVADEQKDKVDAASPTLATTVEPAKPVEKSYAAPEMINEKKPVAKAEPKPEVKAEVKKEAAPKPAEKPKAEAKASTGGAYKLQLGAFKSESEAQAAWKKISAKHGSVVGSTPTIVAADVNGATFYRLRAGSFASSAEAKAACGKLGGQACFPVK